MAEPFLGLDRIHPTSLVLLVSSTPSTALPAPSLGSEQEGQALPVPPPGTWNPSGLGLLAPACTGGAALE